MDPSDVMVELTTQIDHGAVVYLNGAELLRLGLPEGDITFNTRANRGVRNAAWEGPFVVPSELLVMGENLIAVEVHQISPGNSDIVFGLTLDARVTSTDPPVASALMLLDALRVTEIMYNPASGQEHEFIELQNIGHKPLDLSGVRLGGGVEFVFPTSVLEPGQYVVVAADLGSFLSHYGGSVNLTGPFGGWLSNAGDEIELLLPAPYGAAILRFEYDDRWYPPTEGGGPSLVIVNATAEPRSWNEPASWQASLLVGGSPGMADRPHKMGDMNFDGDVDSQDVAGFVLGLSRPDAYAATYGVPACFNGDTDGDGDLDLDDIPGFVSLLGSSKPILGDVNHDRHVNGLDIEPFVDSLLSGVYNAAADMNQDGGRHPNRSWNRAPRARWGG